MSDSINSNKGLFMPGKVAFVGMAVLFLLTVPCMTLYKGIVDFAHMSPLIVFGTLWLIASIFFLYLILKEVSTAKGVIQMVIILFAFMLASFVLALLMILPVGLFISVIVAIIMNDYGSALVAGGGLLILAIFGLVEAKEVRAKGKRRSSPLARYS